MEMIDILKAAISMDVSDIHIHIGKPPMVRIKGVLRSMKQFPVITQAVSKSLIYSILYEEQIQRFEEQLELDSSFDIPGISRFRVNVLLGRNGVEAVLRVIAAKIPNPEELGLNETIVKLTELPRGLVLVTGPTGSGKSTTLACLINIINNSRQEHVLTIEDPIEFVYKSNRCVVRQREVGSNTRSFEEALRHALRQDPDIILVGEMRDLETISLAITAAETGHLVFGTLHTQDAPQTVDRIVDVFPTHQQQQVRAQLGNALQAVICQQLLPLVDGTGRVAVREIMIVTPAISHLIREAKTHLIYSAIETGAKYGMMCMDTHLVDLFKKKKISAEVALSKANNPETIKPKLGLGGTQAL